ncbi:MAG: SHOCT domain-containing protein [Gallionella sp.]|nr:SHOCT domain-containing protein [Gallionella sp.]
MKKLSVFFCALALPFITTGCASVTGSPNQSVSVQTRELAGVEVAGASCELTNDEGKWFVTTPGSVSIHRSNKDLQVSCKKSGFEPGRAAVVSDTKGAMFGNIILGGGIGAIIDHNNGSAYEYPTVIDVLMGSFTKIESPKNPSNQQSNPPSVQTNTALKSQLAASDASAGTTSGTPPASETTQQKLRDLQALRKDGVITEEEYQKKRQQLLDKL